MTESRESDPSGSTACTVKPVLADGDKGVILQRDQATYAVAPHLPCGVVTPEILRRIADVAERYGCQALKLTSAERIALIGLRQEDIDGVWLDLGMKPGGLTGNRVRSVRVCPGIEYCKRGQQDSMAVGQQLDTKFHGEPMPGKVKLSVSGCPNNCTEPVTKDIGLVGTRQGWDLWVGGSGGAAPKLATRIARRCSNEIVLALVDGIVEFYKANARSGERMGKTLARVGLAALTDALGLPRDAGGGEATFDTPAPASSRTAAPTG